MAIGILFLGSVATVGGGAQPDFSEVTIAHDVPAGSYLHTVYHFVANNYALPTFTDDAGNNYGAVGNGSVQNCLALTAGDKITLTHPRGGSTTGEGIVLLAWVYAITGNLVVADAAASTGTTVDPSFDGSLDLSLSISSAAYERAIIGNADGAITSPVTESAVPPSLTGSGWSDHGGQSGNFLAVFPLSTTNQNYAGRGGSQIVAAGTGVTWSANFTYLNDPSSAFTFGVGWRSFKETIPPGANDVSQARTPGPGLLLVAHTNTVGVVKVERYDTSLPPAVAATVTLESASGTGVSLVAHRQGSQILHELLYSHLDVIKRRTSRDGGRNWSVSTTIASGYQDVTHAIDPSTGLAVAALWKESENRWYLAIGERASSGTGDHTYTVVGTLVSNARRGASLVRTAGRRYEFAYRTTSDVLTIIRCKALTAGSVGTWS